MRSILLQDRTHFTPQDRSTVVEFLEDVDLIITSVEDVQTTKQLPTTYIGMLRGMYLYWTKFDLLPEDLLDGKKTTVLGNLSSNVPFLPSSGSGRCIAG
jgi:hypothetical protein